MKRILLILKSTLFFSLICLFGCTQRSAFITVDPSVQPRQDLIVSAYPVEEFMEDSWRVELLMHHLFREYALPVESITEEYPEIMNALLINQYLLHLYSETKLSENELIEYYNNNIDLFRQEARYQIISVFTSQRSRALNFLRGVQEGEEFESLAKEMEPDIQLVHSGWYNLNELPSFLHELVENLEPGETSGLFQSGEGFYIIRLSSLQHGRVLSYGRVKEEIHKILIEKRMNQYLNEIIEEQ